MGSARRYVPGTASWHTSGMVGRDDVHRLVDAVPEAQLPAVEQVLRASLDQPAPKASRQFSSAGTLHAEHDLAERSEDILREADIDGAHGHGAPST